MKKINIALASLLLFLAMLMPISTYAYTTPGSGGPAISGGASNPGAGYQDPAVKCTNYDNCDFIKKYINPFIDILSICFGLVAVISIIIGGINYSTSEGDPQKSSRAKSRIVNAIVAVVAYLFLYSFLQFIVPGGLFNR